MSDDWKPGDLALCVRDGTVSRAGQVFKVDAFASAGSPCGCAGQPGLRFDALALAELQGLAECPFTSDASRFRKINPLTEQERREALRDLKLPERVS